MATRRKTIEARERRVMRAPVCEQCGEAVECSCELSRDGFGVVHVGPAAEVVAAVGHDRRAIDVARRRRAEEERDGGYLVGFAQTMGRDVAHRDLLVVGELGVRELLLAHAAGRAGAGCESVDGDAAVGPVIGQRRGQIDDAGARGAGMGERRCAALERVDVHDVDDRRRSRARPWRGRRDCTCSRCR